MTLNVIDFGSVNRMKWCNIGVKPHYIIHKFLIYLVYIPFERSVKGSPDPSHIFEIKEADPTYNDPEFESSTDFSRSRNSSFNCSRCMSDPPLSDNDFKNKMAWV